ncbi:MAG: hypothetical protein ACI4R9_06545 [Kiritimatiellia bacterium]
MNKFTESVAAVLQIPDIGLDEEFRSVPDWSSDRVGGLLAMMENDWATPLTAARLETLMTVRDLLREAFITFAARLLRVDRRQLSGTSAMGSVPEWDSVNHLRLVMESEREFGFSFALEDIPGIQRIDDFLV